MSASTTTPKDDHEPALIEQLSTLDLRPPVRILVAMGVGLGSSPRDVAPTPRHTPRASPRPA